MLERFDDDARNVVVLASRQASVLGEGVRPVHLVYAIASLERPAGALLRSCGVLPSPSVEPKGGRQDDSQLPWFTHDAKRVLELGLGQSLAMRHRQVTSEHLLLASLVDGDAEVVKLVTSVGAEVETLRSRVAELAGASVPGPPSPPEPPPAPPVPPVGNDGLPPKVAALWYAARPLCGLSAILVAELVSRGVLATLVVTASVVARPSRQGWVHLLLVAVAAPFSVAAAVLLGARGVVTELSIQAGLGRSHGWRRRRARGLARLSETRRKLLVGFDKVVLEPADAAAQLRWAIERGEAARLHQALVESATTTWVEVDGLAFTRFAISAARGLAFDQWPESQRPRTLEGTMRLSMVIEHVAHAITKLAFVCAAGLAAYLAAPSSARGPLGGTAIHILSPAAPRYAFVVLAVWAAAPIIFAMLNLVALMLWVAAVATVGTAGWEPVAIGAVAGLATWTARLARTRLVTGGRRRWRTWAPPPGRRRLRRRWRTADKAAQRGHARAAISLLGSIADHPSAGAELAAAAHARIALLELEQGALEAAANEIGALPEPPNATTAAAAGLVAMGLGDHPNALRYLHSAAEELTDADPVRPRVALALADVLTRAGRSEEAVHLLRDLRTKPLRAMGMAFVTDTEIAIIAALERNGAHEAAIQRLGVMGLDDDALAPDRGPLGWLIPGVVGRRALVRWRQAEARTRLLAGRLALADNDIPRARDQFSRARKMLADEPADTALAATASVLHGAALAFIGETTEEGISLMTRGLDVLEARRTQLSRSDLRAAMVIADVELYDVALQGLQCAMQSGSGAAGRRAAMLIASLRTNALADTLRAGRLALPASARVMTDRIAQLELAGDHYGPDRIGAAGRPTSHDELETLRSGLAAAMSREFAAAYLPRTVTFDRLREVAERHGHVLMYLTPDTQKHAWCVWIDPSGRVELGRIELIGLKQYLSGVQDVAATIGSMVGGRGDRWRGLATLVLPERLRGLLTRASQANLRLLVVPDGPFALVPWAALRPDDVPLVETITVQVAPIIDLDVPASAPVVMPALLGVHLDDALPATAFEREALSRVSAAVFASGRDEFMEMLESRRLTGAYLATHGTGSGLAQQVHFSDDAGLSAATALAYRWPPWVVFAACLVGHVEQALAREPLGLPISCILGGSRSVIGCVTEISHKTAAEVCTELARILVCERLHPAEALRRAQLAHLQANPHSGDCLGLVCISYTEPAGR